MKRSIALLTAVLLFVSVFAFVGCGENKVLREKEPIDVSKLSAEELFQLSFTEGMTEESVFADMISTPSDMVANIEFNINELIFAGDDILDGSASFEIGAALDTDTNNISGDVVVDIFDEKLPISFIVTQDSVFIVDLLGLNDDTIGVSMEDLEALTGGMGGMGGSASMTPYDLYDDYASIYDDYTVDYDDPSLLYGDDYLFEDYIGIIGGAEAPEDILGSLLEDYTSEQISALFEELTTLTLEAFGNAISNNFSADAFTKEMKDVTINGVEYKGAYEVSFTADNATVKKVIEDVINELKSKSELLNELFSYAEMDTNEILTMLDGCSLNITNVVSAAADTVSIDIKLSAAGKTMAFEYTNVETAIDANLGFLDANGNFDKNAGVIFFEYDWDQAAKKETAVLGASLENETVNVMTIDGSYDGETRDGSLEFNFENDGFSLDYYISGDEFDGEIVIDNFTITTEGVKETIDLELSFAYDLTYESAELEFGIDGTIEDTVADLSMVISIELDDISIEAPEDYVSIEELGEMEMLSWISKFPKEYPNIYKKLMALSGSSSGMGGLGGMTGF